MTNDPVGYLPVLVYFGAVLGSLPVALAIYALGWSLDSTARALRLVGAVVAGLVLAGGVALAAFVDPVAGGILVGLAAAAGVVLVPPLHRPATRRAIDLTS